MAIVEAGEEAGPVVGTTPGKKRAILAKLGPRKWEAQAQLHRQGLTTNTFEEGNEGSNAAVKNLAGSFEERRRAQ